jgi:hypothetical protein
MTMASERTCWAEGLGLTEEQVEKLTEIAEAADARYRAMAEQNGNAKVGLNLDPRDVWSEWITELGIVGFDDLADRVRALEPA